MEVSPELWVIIRKALDRYDEMDFDERFSDNGDLARETIEFMEDELGEALPVEDDSDPSL